MITASLKLRAIYESRFLTYYISSFSDKITLKYIGEYK